MILLPSFLKSKNRKTSEFLNNLKDIEFNKEYYSLFIEGHEISLFSNTQKINRISRKSMLLFRHQKTFK